jgi:site-specific DNA recombinase
MEDKFFRDEIDASTYSKAKSRYESEINRFKAERTRLLSVNSEFMNYIDYGFSLLHNLDGYYNEASVEVKQKILSSTFPEKLIFDGETYRTLRKNLVFELLTSNINGLGEVKKKKAVKIDGLSLRASRRGVEPLLQE